MSFLLPDVRKGESDLSDQFLAINYELYQKLSFFVTLAKVEIMWTYNPESSPLMVA